MAAQLNRLLHLADRLRPVLSLGGFERKTAQHGYAVRYLLALSDFIETGLILLCLGIVPLAQSSREAVKGLRFVRIGLNSTLPVFDGLVGFSKFVEDLAQEKLPIGVAWIQRDDSLRQSRRLFDVVVLPFD